MADTKVCPYCGEEIKAGAIKCRYCHTMLNGKNTTTGGEHKQSKNIPGQIAELTSKRDIGSLVVIVTGALAIISMFMKWVDIGFVYQTGFQQGTIIFLLFWIYPVIIAVKKAPINKLWGILCASASIISTIAYIASKSVDFFGENLLLAGTGAWFYLLVSFGMLIGVLIYKPVLTGRQQWWVWAIGIAIMLLVIIFIAFGSEDETTPSGQIAQPHTEGETTEPATTTSVETSPEGYLKAGTYLINDDIVPGRYRSDGGISYWERLSGLSGEFGDIIANGALSSGSLYVDIAATDFAFRFSGSGSFYLIDDGYRGKQKTSFGDGIYLVGVDIEPGRYRSDIGVDYWARLKGFSGDFNDLIANDAMSEGTAYVEIRSTDVGFETKGAQWVKVD